MKRKTSQKTRLSCQTYLVVRSSRQGETIFHSCGTRGRELDRLTQSNLDGREGTAVLGTQRGRSRRLPAPPTPRATEVASRRSLIFLLTFLLFRYLEKKPPRLLPINKKA